MKGQKYTWIKSFIFCVTLWSFFSIQDIVPSKAQGEKIVFAVIGDYGFAGVDEEAVATLVKSWNPDFIVTVGDNNYYNGEQATIDANIGQYYHQYIFPYSGNYGIGSPVRRFFPALGNHDWRTNPPLPYFQYFGFDDQKTYYDFIWGSVHFFVLDSDIHEPDGITATSIQAKWLKKNLYESDSPFNVILLHHAPYSSGTHGSNITLQWPYKQWGADVVIAGHDHTYERLIVSGLPYFVNGIGGKSPLYSFDNILPESKVRFNTMHGAMRAEATDTYLKFQTITHTNVVVDEFTIGSNTIFSSGGYDGWVLEGSENSNIGGSKNYSSNIVHVGDDVMNRQYRMILSFETGSLIPDNAVITRVSLKIKQKDIVGSDLSENFTIDVKKGSFGAPTLGFADFNSLANKTIDSITPTISENWYYFNLTKIRSAINILDSNYGVTQIRLYLSIDDNNNSLADTINFFSGNAPISYRPQLIIDYYLP